MTHEERKMYLRIELNQLSEKIDMHLGHIQSHAQRLHKEREKIKEILDMMSQPVDEVQPETKEIPDHLGCHDPANQK